ncbi:Protein of unknown function [Pyronema omphalodes CBS 100304]|uniref:Uncharacterized protein n=1 Tax=Pyronema omphalodes (strain CBS 100304) TaxID=1076935 RepID=U4KU14_PYROM|nr:Protein of unknown function [Pyronema omphalodes CBS 100304]
MLVKMEQKKQIDVPAMICIYENDANKDSDLRSRISQEAVTIYSQPNPPPMCISVWMEIEYNKSKFQRIDKVKKANAKKTNSNDQAGPRNEDPNANGEHQHQPAEPANSPGSRAKRETIRAKNRPKKQRWRKLHTLADATERARLQRIEANLHDLKIMLMGYPPYYPLNVECCHVLLYTVYSTLLYPARSRNEFLNS